MAGPDHAKPGGIGSAARRLPDRSTVGALAVNNAMGDIFARDGRPLVRASGARRPLSSGNTTLVVIGTDANLDRAQCRKLAQLGHDALAIGIRPTHTLFDGDVVFTMSTGDDTRMAPEAFVALGMAAVDAVGEAIERSIGQAISPGGAIGEEDGP
jgi:L-aminopeptidase/D-esterase-like protein